MGKKEAIALKGCREGVRVIISPDSDIREVLDSLHTKAREYKSFFKGTCNVIVTGREFSQSDKLRINSVMSTILPGCPVSYEAEPVLREEKVKNTGNELPDADIFKEETKKTPGIQKAILKFFGALDVETEDYEEETVQEVPDKMIEVRGRLSQDVYIYDRDVRSNTRLRAAGNLLILGDTEPNSEVVAIGNIYVLGRVRGRIWAGCNGDRNATIISYDLAPDEMRISDIYLRLPNGNPNGNRRPEKAYLSNNTIYIDEYI